MIRILAAAAALWLSAPVAWAQTAVPDDPIPWCELTFRETTGEISLNYWPAEENLLNFSIANGF